MDVAGARVLLAREPTFGELIRLRSRAAEVLKFGYAYSPSFETHFFSCWLLCTTTVVDYFMLGTLELIIRSRHTELGLPNGLILQGRIGWYYIHTTSIPQHPTNALARRPEVLAAEGTLVRLHARRLVARRQRRRGRARRGRVGRGGAGRVAGLHAVDALLGLRAPDVRLGVASARAGSVVNKVHRVAADGVSQT